MEDGGWRMEDGGWRMEDGGWRMEDGGWRMEDGALPAIPLKFWPIPIFEFRRGEILTYDFLNSCSTGDN